VFDAWRNPESNMAESAGEFARGFARKAGKHLAGHRTDLDADAVAFAVFSLVEGNALRVRPADSRPDLDELADGLATIVRSGLHAADSRTSR
jgi:hypothetical protein